MVEIHSHEKEIHAPLESGIANENVDFILKYMKREHIEKLLVEFPEYRDFLDRMHILITSKSREVVVNFILLGAAKKDVPYLHEKMGYDLGPESGMRSSRKTTSQPWTTCSRRKFPAASGSIKCLKFAHGAKLKIDGNSLLVGAQNGHLEVVRFLHEVVGKPLNVRAMEHAAQSGNLAMMRYLHSKSCPWSAGICSMLADCGKLECLIFAHENGCPWTVNACIQAASGGNLACLQYAHLHGCPWDADTCRLALTRSVYNYVYNYAVENGCPGAELSRFKDPLVLIEEDNSPDVSVVTKRHPPSTECILG